MTLSHIFGEAVTSVAVFGVITSTVYSVLVAVGAVLFRRRSIVSSQLPVSAQSPFLPPVSVLKTIHGDEPDLEQNLRSFFEQAYPEFEVLFCARHQHDAGLVVARRVAADYPHVHSRILTCGEPPWPNARTYSMEIMRREARYPILVASDSDVRVGPDYLASVVQPLRDEQAGMVTCLYRGVTRHGLWAQLEAMGMSVEMSSGILVANALEGMQFALGPTMVMRQRSIEKIGGFVKVAQYYAEDFVLGNWMAMAGEKVVLSPYIIEHHVLNSSWKSCLAHQQGWAKSTRFSRPMGHAGTVLTFAIPYGLLALAMLGLTGHLALGLALFGITLADRILLCMMVAGLVVRDRATLSRAWLYPVRDLMGFYFWVWSYCGKRVRWRGELYELLPHGKLRKLAEDTDADPLPAKIL